MISNELSRIPRERKSRHSIPQDHNKSIKPKKTKSQFKKHVREIGLQLNKLTPDQSINAMLSFYRDERADGCAFDDDADMLLFQWDTNDWGDGEFFNFNITRQLTFGDSEDENIWQLSLILKFAPTNAHRKLDSGDKWCGSLDEIVEFDKFIRDSKAYRLVADEAFDEIELNFECT